MNDSQQVVLAHGSGGVMMRALIEEFFIDAYGSDELRQGNDSAILAIPGLVAGGGVVGAGAVGGGVVGAGAVSGGGAVGVNATSSDRLAFTTDSFVVTPRFFPGGDIGRLAVCGTVNDLATSGAAPLWLSVAFILEEGYPTAELRAVCASMAKSAQEAGVSIVTGDTKVVPRGAGDGLYVNTSGIAVFAGRRPLFGSDCQPGDAILLSGSLGDHGMTIISEREGLGFKGSLQSDAAPLNHLVDAVLKAAPGTRCFRDPTRGGLAATINELAEQSNTRMLIEEAAVMVHAAVHGACEMLGMDVFQVANEGKMVAVVPAPEADAALAAMRNNHYGKEAAIIGQVQVAGPDTDAGLPRALVRTPFGSTRVLDTLVGEQLPRIC
ncbi:MAG: hydrogenase expression/formation protein HypE [Actinomycetia bacterium]|nr:hydrogenase expression/formation protein HypE [Actinomycetes bacterium]